MLISDPDRPEELLTHLLQAAGPEASEEIMSLADWLEERGRLKGHREGLTEGRRQGIQEGRLEGQRSTLLKQLRARFGLLPEDVEKRVEAAEERELEVWTERVLRAASLDEVLGGG